MDKSTHFSIVQREIKNAMTELFPHGAGTNDRRVDHWLGKIAQVAFREGEHYTRLSLMTTADVAAQLGITSRAVRKRAKQRSVGWNAGRDWVFLPADLEILAEPGQVGRPPKGD